jgi:hypothetical protein
MAFNRDVAHGAFSGAGGAHIFSHLSVVRCRHTFCMLAAAAGLQTVRTGPASSGAPVIPPLICTPDGWARCGRATWLSLDFLGSPALSGDALCPGSLFPSCALFCAWAEALSWLMGALWLAVAVGWFWFVIVSVRLCCYRGCFRGCSRRLLGCLSLFYILH